MGASNMSQLIAEGLTLMMLGMGAVFVFLTLLVFTTTFMSKMVGKFAPPVPSATKAPSSIPPAQASDDTQLMAVITAAVHQYRSGKN